MIRDGASSWTIRTFFDGSGRDGAPSKPIETERTGKVEVEKFPGYKLLGLGSFQSVTFSAGDARALGDGDFCGGATVAIVAARRSKSTEPWGATDSNDHRVVQDTIEHRRGEHSIPGLMRSH
jgi:hypothetical protein